MNFLIPIFLNISLMFGSSCTIKEASAKSINTKEPKTPVAVFNGKVMQSANGGLTWIDISNGLPEKLVIQAIANDANGVYFGTMESTVLVYDNKQPSAWKTENLKEMMIDMTSKHESIVNGVFSTGTSIYAFAVLEGLFRKINGQQWLPISLPDNVYYINDMQEDNNGNIFLSSINGVYRSVDDGKKWDLILKGLSAAQMLFNKSNILVSTNQGIQSSSDSGITWKKININEVNPMVNLRMEPSQTHSYNLMPWGDGIALLRSDFPIKDAGSGKFQVSMDGGQSWKNHAADSYLSTLEGVTSIISDKGKIYCSYKDGIITSDDDGNSWQPILTFTASQQYESLTIVKSGDILYCLRASMGC